VTPLDIASWAETAVGGSMALALPVALLAGLVSFFSPCVVPLLPGYLSYATGLGAAEVVEGSPRRGRMLAGASLFVLGFAVVFVITGVVAGSAGRLLAEYRDLITRVLGVVIIMLGLIFAGVLKIGQRDLRLHRIPAVGVAAAPLVGVVFALGWTPCLSPTLGVVVNLGFNEGTAIRGGLLGFVYALGLGIPFVLAGLAFTKMASAVAFLRERQQLIMRIGGILMIIVGLLVVTGTWNTLTAMLRQWASTFETVI
jgi:cytochrome c-type biogenesis protein